jgi:hypothetical protein
MKPDPRPFFCVKEASRGVSGLSLARWYRLARLGDLPFFTQGKQLRFRPDDLRAALEADAK